MFSGVSGKSGSSMVDDVGVEGSELGNVAGEFMEAGDLITGLWTSSWLDILAASLDVA